MRSRPPAVVTHGVQADAPPSADWWARYDTVCFEPLAQRAEVIAARRGTAIVGSVAAMVLYDVAPADSLDGGDWGVPAELIGDGINVQTVVYQPLQSTADDYVAPDTEVLHAAFFRAESKDHDEFNDWYDTEHVPAIVAVDGYENCRRFVAADDECSFLALYDVTTIEVAEGETAAAATQSPWSDRVRAKIATYRERRVFIWDRVLRNA